MALLFVMSALLSQLTRLISKKKGNWVGAVVLALLISLSMIGIPYLGVMLATALIVFRNGFILLFENASSAVINQNTESKYRATTLSTYTMMSNVPYVLSAYYLGSLMDFYSPHTVVFILGVLLFLISGTGLVAMRKVVAGV